MSGERRRRAADARSQQTPSHPTHTTKPDRKRATYEASRSGYSYGGARPRGSWAAAGVNTDWTQRGDGAPLRPEAVVQQTRPSRNSPACMALASRTSLFSRIQREVIDPGCVDGCHSAQDGAQGGLELNLCDDSGNARRLGRETGPGGRAWIVPGNPGASRLMDSLMGRNGAPRMPAQGLPQAQIDLVAQWIREGGGP